MPSGIGPKIKSLEAQTPKPLPWIYPFPVKAKRTTQTSSRKSRKSNRRHRRRHRRRVAESVLRVETDTLN